MTFAAQKIELRQFAVLALVCSALVLNGQTQLAASDTTTTKNLPDITVVERRCKCSVSPAI